MRQQTLNKQTVAFATNFNKQRTLRAESSEPHFMIATVTAFRRRKDSEPELGFAIGEVDVIVDKHGKVVPAPIWNYVLCWDKGTLNVDLDK